MSIKPFLPAALWLVAITYLSVSAGIQLPKVTLISPDKLGHAAAYALLVWLMLWGIRKTKHRSATSGEMLLVFAFAAAYGAFMEWVQGTYFPNRFFEYDDMLANAAGAFLAIMVYRFIPKSPNPQLNK
jgi:VanZ family protein